jgi:NAD+ synthase (glutamine-hydrolysing)
MKLIRLAAGVLNQTPLDWDGNLRNILESFRMAREEGVSLLCLPEMCITGYGCEDAFHSRGVHRTALQVLADIAAEAQGLVVSVGMPLMYAGGLFNTACLIVDGRIAGFVGKQHLAGDGIHYEPRWFKRWPDGVMGEVELPDQREVPIGDLLFNVGSVRIGFEICEDAWVGDRPGSRHSARGADIILNPSASHFAFEKHAVRRGFVVEGSRAFHVSYVYTNLVGNESGRAIYDGDAMIATGGKLIAEGRRFSFRPVSLTCATVDVEATRMTRARMSSFEPDLDGDESDVFPVPFEWPACGLDRSTGSRDEWESSPNIKFEEFTHAVGLGLYDYMRKSRSRGFVVSLSGGVDSTSVVILIHYMFRRICQEIGVDGFLEATKYLDNLRPASAEDMMYSLLTTVYQSTRNSGHVTRSAAQKVAEAVGCMHFHFDVDGIFRSYIGIVSNALQRPLTWANDDLALQNIQARVRSPGVWMLANLQNGLLLSTSNRSETAVGYATMDGDTSGGLAPLAGIDKAFLRKWLKWVEKDGPIGLGPVPQVDCVNVQQPTAELRPPGENQTDEGDLMPYEVLDAIEGLAILDKLMPLEVLSHLEVQFADTDRLQLGKWIIRFFNLWCRNQWKRERFAPSFHLDDKNLDPKTWCRFPILSGGFERELGELRKELGIAGN